MVKPIITMAVDTVGGLVAAGNEAVENVVEMVPGIGEPFVDKVWSPATDLVGKLIMTPFKMLGLTKKFR